MSVASPSEACEARLIEPVGPVVSGDTDQLSSTGQMSVLSTTTPLMATEPGPPSGVMRPQSSVTIVPDCWPESTLNGIELEPWQGSPLLVVAVSVTVSFVDAGKLVSTDGIAIAFDVS